MTLLAPLFLLGLVGIGLPIVLHRLQQDNPVREPFSSLMLLEPGRRHAILKKRLRYLLLLALRIALLALIALTFARPIWENPAVEVPAAERERHVIFVDTSLSMNHGARWERARAEARSLIAALSPADEGQLVAAGSTVELIAGPTTDHGLLSRGLAALEPGSSRLDYGELTGALDGLVRGSELAVRVHIVTDAQRSALPTRFADLSPQTRLALAIHDVSEPGAENWWIGGVGSTAGAPDELRVSLRNLGGETTDKTLALYVNGSRAGLRTATVPGGGQAWASFENLELAPGLNRIRVSLEPADELPEDDQYFVVVDKPLPAPVLLLDGASGEAGALYLSSALQALDRAEFEVERTATGSGRAYSPEDYVFIMVPDAGTLGSRETERLKRYVTDGGSILMGLGARAAALETIPVTGHEIVSLGAPGERPDSSWMRGDNALVGTIDTDHDALQHSEGWRGIRFRRYLPVAPQPADQVLLRLENGTPLLLEHQVGSGRVLLFASAFDNVWSDLPAHPVFVPFMGDVARYLSGGNGLVKEATLGSTLALRAMGRTAGQVFDPTGNRVLALADTTTADAVSLEKAGFYEVRSPGTKEYVAVNPDPRESDLTPVEPATLERWRAAGTGAGDVSPSTGAAVAIEAPPLQLWHWLLALVAALALVESFVANRHLAVRRESTA